jgi:thioredoxin reductase (NADPH)
VALVIATSLEWLTHVHEVCPGAVRCVLVRYGDGASYPAVRQAIVLVVGERWAHRCHELRDVLERSSVPYEFHPHDSEVGRRLLEEAGHTGSLPAVIFGDRCLCDPSNVEIAEMLGARTRPEGGLYDLVVIGGGPAGLAAAVYGAADGLRTLVVERQAVGGQAGTSSMIRNYLGFPRGISGAELAQRAQEQAASLARSSS